MHIARIHPTPSSYSCNVVSATSRNMRVAEGSEERPFWKLAEDRATVEGFSPCPAARCRPKFRESAPHQHCDCVDRLAAWPGRHDVAFPVITLAATPRD